MAEGIDVHPLNVAQRPEQRSIRCLADAQPQHRLLYHILRCSNILQPQTCLKALMPARLAPKDRVSTRLVHGHSWALET